MNLARSQLVKVPLQSRRKATWGDAKTMTHMKSFLSILSWPRFFCSKSSWTVSSAFLLLACSPRAQVQTCTKSYISLKKEIAVQPLSSIAAGGELDKKSPNGDFVASGMLKMQVSNGNSAGFNSCAAIVLFTKISEGYDLEVITSKHCTSDVLPTGHKIYISGLDGYREILIESSDISRQASFRAMVKARNLEYRKEILAGIHRPFERLDFREKIGDRELDSAIQQELSLYGGYMCGNGTLGPKSINAQKACFLFSDMVTFKAKPQQFNENLLLSIRKGGNTSKNFLASAHPAWMDLLRSRGSVFENHEIGRALDQFVACGASAGADAPCDEGIKAKEAGFLSELDSKKMLAQSLFAGFSSGSRLQREQMVQKSVDDLIDHYSRQSKLWQSIRADFSKRSVTLGANLQGSSLMKFSLVEFKMFQGSIPFIWRPYGIIGYVDLSLASLQKGVSGSFVFLDNTPFLALARVDDGNTSGGVAIPRPDGMAGAEIKLPSADILNAAQWKDREEASTKLDKSKENADKITYGRTDGC